MEIHEIENEIISFDKIKTQRLVSWLTHKDIAIAALLFSAECANTLLSATSLGGRKIVEEEMEKYSDTYEDLINEVLVKIKKYMELIFAGKGLDQLEE